MKAKDIFLKDTDKSVPMGFKENDNDHYMFHEELNALQYFEYKFGKFPNKILRDGISDKLQTARESYYVTFDFHRLMADLRKAYPTMSVNYTTTVRADNERQLDKLMKDNEMYDTHATICIDEIEMTADAYTDKAGVRVYYSNYEKAEKAINIITSPKYIKLEEKEKPTKKVYLIQQQTGGYGLIDSEVKQYKVDINKHYNDDFKSADKKIKDFIKEDNTSGLVILNGIKGTGKTTYIRHLINTSERKFIYMTRELASSLAQPAFISFMKEIKGCVLIIEDCEDLVSSREGYGMNNNGISTLLNLCDGLLSDVFNIKIIVTFNTDISRIDTALLRKGRLRCRYEFGKLAADKCNKIFKSLKIKYVTTEPMALCDVFNFEVDNGAEEDTGKHIGF